MMCYRFVVLIWFVPSPSGFSNVFPFNFELNTALKNLSRSMYDMTGQMSGHVTPIVTPLCQMPVMA
jgi:hypothetical protein